MKRIYFVLFALFTSVFAFSQNLFVPIEYQKAIQNQTRTYRGLPGKNYWINHSDYVIKADFNPLTGELKGDETITYHNNSQDTLKMLVVRLYQDVWKKGVSRDFQVPETALTDGTKLSKIVVNGQEYNPDSVKRYNTLLFITLKNPIMPHSRATVQFSWQTQMPSFFPMRYGKYDDRTFFVAYWYPEIAVYDDVYGWDRRNFTGMQEFHNDHNNFDVTISVLFPNLVWATGHLVNAQEIFDQHILDRIERAKKSDKVIHIVTEKDLSGNLLKKLGKIKWHFVARQVPEFAFGTSDKYVWDATSLKVKDKRVFISAVYNPKHKTFNYMASLVRNILKQYSYTLPAIPYPYEAMTIFNGGGAMEFPMMVNESEFKDTCMNYYVTAHEVGHSYFPFMTGTNETMYAWMDEGLINYFPRYVARNLNKKCTKYFTDMVARYKRIAGTSNDLPIGVPTSDVANWTYYRHIAYNKPAFAFYVLTDYLGKDLFFKALREFALRWKFRHPYPWDFFETFNDVTGQNLNWFWQRYFFEFTYPDLVLSNVKFHDNKVDLQVQNAGQMPVPFSIIIKCADGQKIEKQFKIDSWKDSNVLNISLPVKSAPIEIQVKDKFNVDLNPSNNLIKL